MRAVVADLIMRCVVVSVSLGITAARADDAPVFLKLSQDAPPQIIVTTGAGTAGRRAAELVVEVMKARAGVAARLVEQAGAGPTIELAVVPPADGAPRGMDRYRIACDPAARRWTVTGETASGLVAGVGRLLRSMRFEGGHVGLPTAAVAAAPRMPIRGMYPWARQHYFGQPDALDRLIEEWALWGCNDVILWFELGMFPSFDAPEAQRWLAMYRRHFDTARRIGMRVGILLVANDGYSSSPQAIRVAKIIGTPDHYVCPSRPEGARQLLAWQKQVLGALPHLDSINIFPADPGGCSCPRCQPWPTRGFWTCAEPLAEAFHERFPRGEVWIDFWHLHHPTFGGDDWQNLVRRLAADRPPWLTGIQPGMAPHHGFAHVTPEQQQIYGASGLPISTFPEVSMWGNHPGMLVNTTYWEAMRQEITRYPAERMRGGWPYTERWNTDIANVAFLEWFWNPDTSVDAVLDDYCGWYFGPAAGDVRKLLELLDDSNRDPDRAATIRGLRATLDGRLPAWARADWRWREIARSCDRFAAQ